MADFAVAGFLLAQEGRSGWRSPGVWLPRNSGPVGVGTSPVWAGPTGCGTRAWHVGELAERVAVRCAKLRPK